MRLVFLAFFSFTCIVSCGDQEERGNGTNEFDAFELTAKEPTFTSPKDVVSILQNDVKLSYIESIFSGAFLGYLPVEDLSICGRAELTSPKIDQLLVERSLDLLQCRKSNERADDKIESATLETKAQIQCEGVNLESMILDPKPHYELSEFKSKWVEEQPCFDAPRVRLKIKQLHSIKYQNRIHTIAMQMAGVNEEFCVLQKAKGGQMSLTSSGCQLRYRWYSDGPNAVRKDVSAHLVWDRALLRHDRSLIQGGQASVKINNWSGTVTFADVQALRSSEPVKYSIRSDRTLLQGVLEAK
jgi:hypothetical protein